MNKIGLLNSKIILFILFVFCFTTSIKAQQQEKSRFWNQVRFGGGLGLSFANGFFSGTIAPSAIYEFNNTIALGVGLNGTFNSQKNVYKSTILGGSLIGLINPLYELQLSAEFEQLHVSRKYNFNVNRSNETYWLPALFIGAGYRSGNVTLGIRYDLLYDKEKSIYPDSWAPFVRFYF